MIYLHEVSLSFSNHVIFDKASLHIYKGQKIGVCAPNGTGKSTLFNCIAGRIEINSGSININTGAHLEYFEQQGIELGDKTIREELQDAYRVYFSIKEEIHRLEHSLDEYKNNLKKMQYILDMLEHLYEKIRAYNYEHREAEMMRVLKGLGFRHEDLDRVGGEFSGGWQTKVGLAKVLLSNPDILLLDEPTNHLDLEAREWLLDLIKNLDCTLLLISHDRYFLDNAVEGIVDLSGGSLIQYKGNYSQYETQLKNSLALQEKHRKQYLNEVAKQEVFIERFRYKASKAKQVQSRIKSLEKLEKKYNLLEEGVLEAPVEISKNAELLLHFPHSRNSGTQVLEAIEICKIYDGILTLDSINFNIDRGEKVALLGPNGVGKSTLMRIIAKQDQDYSGEIQWGAHTHIAYFSQKAADLLNG